MRDHLLLFKYNVVLEHLKILAQKQRNDVEENSFTLIVSVILNVINENRAPWGS